MSATEGPGLQPLTPEGRSAGSRMRLVIGAVLVVILIALLADNSDDTRIGYVFGDVEAPLFLVLVVAAVLGALIGWLVLHRPHRHSD